MKSFRILAAAFVASCLMSVAAFAADATGSWKWTQMGRQGGTPQEITAKFTAKDGKLTGTVTQPGRGGGAPMDVEISDGAVKGDTVTFSLVREFGGNKIVTKYEGKLDGDTIKGTMLAPGRGGGEPTPREWTATRAKM
jgi:hypothetical protein